MGITDGMSREELLRVQSAGRLYQERADNALAPWSIRAPAPVLGQPIEAYRRDLAVMLKKQLPEQHELRRVSYRRLDDATLSIFESKLYPAVYSEAYNPANVPVGQLRSVIEIDQGGTKSTVREGGRICGCPTCLNCHRKSCMRASA